MLQTGARSASSGRPSDWSWQKCSTLHHLISPEAVP